MSLKSGFLSILKPISTALLLTHRGWTVQSFPLCGVRYSSTAFSQLRPERPGAPHGGPSAAWSCGPNRAVPSPHRMLHLASTNKHDVEYDEAPTDTRCRDRRRRSGPSGTSAAHSTVASGKILLVGSNRCWLAPPDSALQGVGTSPPRDVIAPTAGLCSSLSEPCFLSRLEQSCRISLFQRAVFVLYQEWSESGHVS